ncbi:MAG: hypothetical protein E6J91_31415 [Deltaproteobacteria bacterium]|nr:MAG: hypothetical protein E6J91_31415 [Deltaproteobacteria bacterium]
MITHAIRLSLLSGLLIAACGEGPDVVRVTIDMRCDAKASCPAGFACMTETEHGPPTTLCESSDPAATCPPGYEAKVGYGQTFCKPHQGVSSRSHASTSAPVRSRRTGRNETDL